MLQMASAVVGLRHVPKPKWKSEEAHEFLNGPDFISAASDPARIEFDGFSTESNGSTLRSPVLVLDEIQKVTDWSSLVRLLWDADTHSGVALKVVLLGSSSPGIKTNMLYVGCAKSPVRDGGRP
jgi:hypothetical protein